jgi:hypothetical protein
VNVAEDARLAAIAASHPFPLVFSAEQGVLPASELTFHEREFQRLLAELQQAPATSPLPDVLPAEVARELHDFLVRVRLA